MPKAAKATGAARAAQAAVTPYFKAINSPNVDKENISPNANDNNKKKTATAAVKKTTKKSTSEVTDISKDAFMSLELEMKVGERPKYRLHDNTSNEVPIYESASSVRQKLNKLVSQKTTNMPGTSKPFTFTGMADLMVEIKKSHPEDIDSSNMTDDGPSARALKAFLSKKGGMGGADSECYYWGWIILEKLRILKNEKKTKARLDGEAEYVLAT